MHVRDYSTTSFFLKTYKWNYPCAYGGGKVWLNPLLIATPDGGERSAMWPDCLPAEKSSVIPRQPYAWQSSQSARTLRKINKGWGKISSVLSVGHCEGRGGRRRMGLGSKGAGSWEVPVTTLCSHKDGVVQWAARICRRNLLFAKSLYRSGAACVPYSLPNPPSGPSTGPKIHSVVGWELQGNGKCVWKKMRATMDLWNTREHRECQTIRFAVSQVLCTQTPSKQRPPLARNSF